MSPVQRASASLQGRKAARGAYSLVETRVSSRFQAVEEVVRETQAWWFTACASYRFASSLDSHRGDWVMHYHGSTRQSVSYHSHHRLSDVSCMTCPIAGRRTWEVGSQVGSWNSQVTIHQSFPIPYAPCTHHSLDLISIISMPDLMRPI